MEKAFYNINRFKRLVVFISFMLASTFLSAQESSSPTNNQTVLASSPKSAQQISFTADDDFLLSADYYLGDVLGAGVLLLHDCAHNNKSYSVLGELLAKQGIHALALDFRGFGASESNEFSHQAIKKQVKNIVGYQAEVATLTSYWEKDVLYAYNYLRNKIGKEQPISIVASGCAVNEAVLLAQKIRINSFVILSPIMDYMEKEHYKNLIDIPAYFVSSAHHSSSAFTAQELFSWNGDSRSTSQVFKGVSQGHSLLRRNKFLANNIALWLQRTLN